jgi:hypothetical protein
VTGGTGKHEPPGAPVPVEFRLDHCKHVGDPLELISASAARMASWA